MYVEALVLDKCPHMQHLEININGPKYDFVYGFRSQAFIVEVSGRV